MPRPVSRIAVIGGSLGGLFAAALLLRRGFDVQVFERNPSELSGRGAGIMTHPEMLAALRGSGIESGDDFGIKIPRRRTYARDGSVLGEMPFPQVATSWERVLHLLRAAVPDARYHLGRSLVQIDQGADGVTARFADGSSTSADLLVAADGIRSSARAQLMPDAVPAYAGYVAWRGLVDEAALSPASHAALMHDFTFGLPPGEQILAYPVPGSGNTITSGQRRCNIVWYRPVDAVLAFPLLLTDDAGTRHGEAIPPPLIARGVLAAMRADANRLLPPAFAEAIRCIAVPILQPIYDLTVPHMAFGRVALIGDAAFVARPHVGAGVTKVMADALALADALDAAENLAAALTAFETARLAEGQRIVAHSRALGAYLEANIDTAAGQAAAARHREADTMMRETATLAFLSGHR